MELAVGLLEGLHGDLQGIIIRLVAVDGALQLVQLCVDEQGVPRAVSWPWSWAISCSVWWREARQASASGGW